MRGIVFWVRPGEGKTGEEAYIAKGGEGTFLKLALLGFYCLPKASALLSYKQLGNGTVQT